MVQTLKSLHISNNFTCCLLWLTSPWENLWGCSVTPSYLLVSTDNCRSVHRILPITGRQMNIVGRRWEFSCKSGSDETWSISYSNSVISGKTIKYKHDKVWNYISHSVQYSVLQKHCCMK